MADQDPKKSPKTWLIAALIGLLLVAALVFFMSQNGRGGDQTSATSDSMPAEDGAPAAAQPSGQGGSAPAGG